MKHIGFARQIVFLIGVVLLGACANTRNVLAPYEHVLYKQPISVKMVDGSEPTPEVREALTGAKRYLKQEQRNGFLNIHHWFVNPYYWQSISDSSWWANAMRTLGTPMTIFAPARVMPSCQQLENLLDSKGCFGSTVTADSTLLSHNRMSVNYSIKARPRYLIHELEYRIKDTVVEALVHRHSAEALIHEGDYYDAELLTQERSRLVTLLQGRGYYLATPDLVHFVVDTTYSSRLLSIEVVVDNPTVLNEKHEREERPFQRYFIRNVNVDSNSVSQSIIAKSIALAPGRPYMPQLTTYTYNGLVNLQNFKHIDISYQEAPTSSDSLRLLDANIHLLNNTRRNISLSFEFNNASPIAKQTTGNFLTNGNIGLEGVLQYRNRNLFGGAEIFTTSGNLQIELSKNVFKKSERKEGDDIRRHFSAFETGINCSLDLPSFLFPFGNDLLSRGARPHTVLSIGTDYQYRTYFERTQAEFSFGYSWNYRQRSRHRLTPIELSYVQFPWLSEDFVYRIFEILDQRIAYKYTDHLILDGSYEYVYTNQTPGRRRDFSFFRGSVESAGGLASLFLTGPNAQRNAAGHYTFHDVEYSQYLRFIAEYKHYFFVGESSTLVLRGLLGVGIPYGNSTTMPYEKSFFGGGPNTIRAWQIRQLGPGGYVFDDDIDWDRIGDIQLVLNVEHRFPLFSILEGAMFVDAGNVWMSSADEYYENGSFRFSDFYRQLAVGIGLGLRLKISILTVRADFAIPLVDPGNSNSWRLPHWRFNQIVPHIAIDYPF